MAYATKEVEAMRRLAFGLMAFLLIPSSWSSAQSITAFMLRTDTADADLSHELVRIDMTHSHQSLTWDPELPAEIGHLGLYAHGGCLSPAGDLIALDHVNDRLLRVDLGSGSAEVSLSLSLDVGHVCDIAFSPSGELWLASTNSYQSTQIYTVDTVTGDVQLIGTTDRWVEKLVFHNGHLYGTGFEELLEIDTVTAGTTFIREYSAPESAFSVLGLASDGDDLWMLYSGVSGAGGGTGGPYYPQLARLDPTTGLLEEGIWIGGEEAWCFYALAMIQQPAPVPSQTSLGLALMTVLLAGLGILVLRR
jgi:hypothetical protein